MSRRPARFTVADVRRAQKASGKPVAVEILPDGTIRLIPIESMPAVPAPLPEEREIVL